MRCMHFALASRRCKSSNRSCNAALQAVRVERSSANVRSVLTDLRIRSGLTGRSSFPRDSWCSRVPNLPNRRTNSLVLICCRSPQVCTSIALSFLAVTEPTPNILFTGSLTMNSSISSGVTVNWPSGLFQSDAIFARNLLGAMPAEMVIPTSSRTRSRISVAMRVALPW